MLFMWGKEFIFEPHSAALIHHSSSVVNARNLSSRPATGPFACMNAVTYNDRRN